jgi:hypothetical protein
VFDVERTGNSKGTIIKVCTLREIGKWLDDEKRKREFWIGVIIISILSIASIIWRLQLNGKK